MKFTICSSSNDSIDVKYKESSKKLLDYLVTIKDAELNWGSGSSSIMGLCYQTFSNASLPIHGFTTSKYVSDIDNLPKANHTICDTTYDLKKEIFYSGDIIIILPGGTGSISEFFSHLEEIRSNDANKLLVVWNENHFYDLVIELIKDLVNKSFNNQDIFNYFKIANNLDDLKNIIEEYKKD